MTNATQGSAIVVAGAGLVGTGWAALFAAFGHDVRIYDTDPAAPIRSLPLISAALDEIAAVHGVHATRLAPDQIVISDDLPMLLDGAWFMQEAIVENIDAKRALFQQAWSCSPSLVIASSTSHFTWADLACGVNSPGQLLIAHPFVPVHLLPLVEIYGPDSNAPIIPKLRLLYEDIRKHIVLIDAQSAGLIGNRLQHAMAREIFALLIEGVARPAAIDAVVMHGLGLRWASQGPIAAFHLAAPGGIRETIERFAPPDFPRNGMDAFFDSIDHDYPLDSMERMAFQRNALLVEQLKISRTKSMIDGLPR